MAQQGVRPRVTLTKTYGLQQFEEMEKQKAPSRQPTFEERLKAIQENSVLKYYEKQLNQQLNPRPDVPLQSSNTNDNFVHP